MTGLVLGILAMVVGFALPFHARMGLLVALTGAIIGSILLGRPLRLPERRRMIGQEVVAMGDSGGPMMFGAQLGTGVMTHLTSPLAHLMAGVVLLVGNPVAGLLVGFGFGMGRLLFPLAGHLVVSYDLFERQWTSSAKSSHLVNAAAALVLVGTIAWTVWL